MTGSNYKATFDTSGSGNWEITLPADIDMHDFMALGPVVQGIKEFLAPTIDPDEPVPYQLTDPPAAPDLTA